ncbi:MAG: ATP-binding cassette domain-containing protein [Oscillospiraceae bacterium]|nr:ATP-binding cassette domain-containing protein [Oscillospiraceae bacterium]
MQGQLPVLECRALCLGYERREVLHELSFVLREGERLCVLGENGTGKSTLLLALLGLKRPTKGEIIYGADSARRQIGYLPQQLAVQQDFPARAVEVVRSGFLGAMGPKAWYTREQRARAGEIMAQLGVAELADRCFRELSGGQQRRVLLARALCATRRLLLLDEPEAGLDPIAAKELAQLIRALHKDKGIAVIQVSHEVESALDGADYVLHLTRGAFEGDRFFGTAEEYRASPLGQDYMMNCRAGRQAARRVEYE